MATVGSEYAVRLGLPVPRVEDVVCSHEAKLFHLLIVALLERGGPMTVEEIAERLELAGVEAATGDMVYSLQKAWHGSQPIFRDQDGRFGLNLTSRELDIILYQLALRRPRVEPVAPPPEPPPVSDDVPLSEAEVRAAFHCSSMSSVSTLRQAAAVLDARGEEMSIAAVEEYVSRLTKYAPRLGQTDMRRWTRSCIRVTPDGRLQLDRTSPDVPAMRRAIRKLAIPRLRQEAHAQHWERVARERELITANRHKHERQIADGLRRAVLRLIPDSGSPSAAALLDVGARVVRTFVASELADLRTAIESMDLIAAFRPRESLNALGITEPDRWRLVDLKPPQKTRRLNRQGRTLSITPELLITSATGISRPLGDTAKLIDYITSGSIAKLRRRIESDVKALFAFYNYGRLHNAVRLRWGFLDESLPVDWAVPGDLSLYDVIKDCQASGTPVDLVAGSAPGWSDPWSRAIRVHIVSIDFGSVLVDSAGEQWHIPRQEIQAVRPVTSTSATHLA